MKKSISLVLLVTIALAACNFNGTAGTAGQGSANTEAAPAATATVIPPTETPAPTETSLPATVTPTLTPQFTATSAIYPLLTLAVDTVCRMGPDKHYYSTTAIAKGRSFEANGRSADSTWIVLQAPRIGDYCWVPVASLDNPGDLSALSVATTQPLPGQPLNFTASSNACGTTNLWLRWVTVDAVGYHIYRNGKQIATVYGSQYRDLVTPRTKLPTVYQYAIEGFNASGASDRAIISVTICG